MPRKGGDSIFALVSRRGRRNAPRFGQDMKTLTSSIVWNSAAMVGVDRSPPAGKRGLIWDAPLSQVSSGRRIWGFGGRMVAQVSPLSDDGAAHDDARLNLAGTLASLPQEWKALRDRSLDQDVVDAVLVHPDL